MKHLAFPFLSSLNRMVQMPTGGQDTQGSTRKATIEATQHQMSLDTAYVNRAGFLFFFVFVVQIFKHIYEVQEIKCKITH